MTTHPDDILYVARHRCQCGAGLAIPVGGGDAYHCSRELLGQAAPHFQPRSTKNHSYQLEVEEGSPTTRPDGLTEQNREWLLLRMRGAELSAKLASGVKAMGTSPRSSTKTRWRGAERVWVGRDVYKALCAYHRTAPLMWDALGFLVDPMLKLEPTETLEVRLEGSDAVFYL